MKNFDKNQLKRLLSIDAAIIAILTVIASGAMLLRLTNSLLPKGFYLPYCLAHDLLHLYCPFCGCTRAGLSLLRLDIVGSLTANPLVLLFVLAVAVFNAISLFRARRGRSIPDISRLSWPALALLLTFAVARNILMIFFDFDTLGELAHFWL